MCFEISVVCAAVTGVVPNSLQGIEFWGVCRKIGNFDMFAMIAEPIPYGAVFVIGSIVLDEINFLRKVTAQNFFEIFDISLSVEDILEMIKEPGAV